MVLFYLSPDKAFKHFCRYGVEQEFCHYFADLPSTDRFMAVVLRPLLPFYLLLHCYRGQKIGRVPMVSPGAQGRAPPTRGGCSFCWWGRMPAPLPG